MEGLCPRHRSRMGKNWAERVTLQRRHRGEVLQQRELGLGGLEKAAHKECEDPDGTQESIPTAEKCRKRLHLDHDPESAVCAAFGHATSTRRSVDVC